MASPSTTVRLLTVITVISLTSSARLVHAQVTFTPAAELTRTQGSLPAGITFTRVERPASPTTASSAQPTAPASSPAASVAVPTPPTQERHRESTPATTAPPTPATTSHSDRQIAAHPETVTQAPLLRATATPAVLSPPTAGARVITNNRSPVAPTESRPSNTRCSIEHGVETIALNEGELRATSVLLAANSTKVVAHINLSRPGTSREGLQFPSALLLSFSTRAHEQQHHVHSTVGLQPGAAIALNDQDQLFAISHSRVAPTRTERGSLGDLQWIILDTNGTVRSPFRTIANSRNFSIDSQPVAWRGGWAVVLGESSNPAAPQGAELPPLRERVYSFDAAGTPQSNPWILTETQRPESVSRFRVGLGAVSTGDTLAAVFADSNGLWLRQFTTGEPHDAPTRIARGTVWSPEIASDGGGVVFREDGYNGQPVHLRLASFREGPTIELGTGWEPLAAVHRDITLVAGALMTQNGRSQNVLFTESDTSHGPRTIALPHDDTSAVRRLDDALDVAFVSTNDGAMLAWIEPVGDPNGPRQLAVARARCTQR